MHTVTLEHKNYPELLKQIKDPPQQLYVLGTLQKSENYPLAVVGTRKVSSYGKQVTEYFVRSLARAGMTIISGLALGIDGLAHKTTLEENGRTIAVLGAGLDHIFPAAHKKLAHDIVESGGAIVTEYSPDTPALRAYFPQRNRIISGLSLGVLVIEAPEKSGALLTAEHAFKQGRKVFATPGRIYDKNSTGTNELIQCGAIVVTKPEHILQKLDVPDLSPDLRVGPSSNLSENEKILLGCLSNDPVHIDDLSKQCKLDIHKIIAHLTQMEIQGLVKDMGDGHYIRT